MAGNRSSFHSHPITDLNYANQVKLNDSSNNRLLTDLLFFFFFYERVLSSRASGCLRHHHRPFIDHYGNGDNLFVRCPLYASLGRCWESTIPTFRLLLLTFPNLVISCVVLLLCWLKSMWSCLGAHFAKPWTLLLSFYPNWQGFCAPGMWELFDKERIFVF